MSTMVISSVKRFIQMSEKLEDFGVDNIHFFNSRGWEDSTPMVALVPSVDFVVLGNDASSFPHLRRIIDEALLRHIPLVGEECLNELNNFFTN